MKRLTLKRLTKEFEKAKNDLDNHWNDIEIQVGGRNIQSLYCNSPKKAFDRWKEETGGEYRYIYVRLNHIDKDGDIQDACRSFEHEAGY